MTGLKLAGLADFAVNKVAEKDGAWMPLVGRDDGSAIKLRSQAAPRVKRAAAEQQKKHIPTYRANKIPPQDVLDREQDELLAKHVITDWKGPAFVLETGETFPCTPENALLVLQQFPLLKDDIIRWSDDRKNYQDEAMAAMAGNSASTSEPS